MPDFLRDWRPGDPPPVRGRSLWADEIGEVWLSPAEVKALGLTGAMREGLENPRPEPVPEPRRTDDVRPPTEGEDSAVSANDYFEEDEGTTMDLDPDHKEARDAFLSHGVDPGRMARFAPGREEPESRSRAAEYVERVRAANGPRFPGAWNEALRAALEGVPPEPRPLAEAEERATPPSGAAGGWRWWWAVDGDDRWLAYDNRPTIEARDADPATRERLALTQLRQGAIPWAVISAAMLAPWPEAPDGPEPGPVTADEAPIRYGSSGHALPPVHVDFRRGTVTPSADAFDAGQHDALAQRCEIQAEARAEAPACPQDVEPPLTWEPQVVHRARLERALALLRAAWDSGAIEARSAIAKAADPRSSSVGWPDLLRHVEDGSTVRSRLGLDDGPRPGETEA